MRFHGPYKGINRSAKVAGVFAISSLIFLTEKRHNSVGHFVCEAFSNPGRIFSA